MYLCGISICALLIPVFREILACTLHKLFSLAFFGCCGPVLYELVKYPFLRTVFDKRHNHMLFLNDFFRNLIPKIQYTRLNFLTSVHDIKILFVLISLQNFSKITLK